MPTTEATVLAPDSPFFAPSPLPLEAPPFDRIRDEHFLPALRAGMQQHLAQVRAIAAQSAPATFGNTIEALERSGALLARVAKVFFNLTASHTNPALQKVQAEVAPLLAAHEDTIHLDADLFARIQAVHAARDRLPDAEQRRLVERYHAEFVRSGAQLDAARQQTLRAYNTELSQLTTKFQEQLLADTNASAVLVDDVAELAGLDPSAISAAATAAGHPGQYRLGLELPTSQGVLASLQVRRTRERVFLASCARGSRGDAHDTRELVRRIARLRADRAALLGFPNHAAYVLSDQMAGSAEAVQEMLGSMTAAIVGKAQAEAAELQAHLDATPGAPRLAAWDWAFVAEQVGKARFDFDESSVRQFFELESVLQQGLFFVANELYGITLRERRDLPVYHPDVRVFDVLEASGAQLGLFYADFFARPSKRGGAWMDGLVDQSHLLGKQPVVLNVLNLQKPGPGQPVLLSFDEVKTLFHEFGHAVHGLFSDVHYPLLSGTSVPRDFVEFPSQFHEDFAFDPRVLQRYARHHATGEPLAPEVIERIRRARTFGQGFASLEYLAAAVLDMAWHTLPPGTDVADVDAFEAAALQRAGVASELVPPRYRSAYFAHIWPGGYSAGYYAYLWAEALAADGFAAVMERGGLRRENGQRFRETVLSRGFASEPMAMFRAFRGRELDTAALLQRRGLTG